MQKHPNTKIFSLVILSVVLLCSCVTGFANGGRFALYATGGRDSPDFLMPEDVFPPGGTGNCTLCMDLSGIPRTTEYITAPIYPATFVVGASVVFVGRIIYLGVDLFTPHPERIADEERYADELKTARASDASPEELTKLADHGCEKVRIAVAQNPNTSIPVLEKLVMDTSPTVCSYAKETLSKKQPEKSK